MIINKRAPFVENNIHFRIISSKILERYKSTQSFVLTEMIHGQFKFSKTSREIALLKMDIWFLWLNDFESYLIHKAGNIFEQKDVEYATNEINITREYYRSTVDSRDDIFDRSFVSVLNRIDDLKFKDSEMFITECSGKSLIDTFASVSNFLIEIIDTLKFELYEIDYLINGGKKPFLCMTNLCVLYETKLHSTPLVDRALVYIDEFNISNGFIFKNYSQEMSPVKCLESIQKANIKINNNTDLELGGGMMQ